MSFTEEGIPIRTIYVPELTINATNGMLRDYFREFGAIERVVISPERIHGNEPVDEAAANPVDFFNQQQNGQRNYFAYVTYVTQHGAQTALRETIHTIQNHETQISAAFSWNQAHTDVQEYLTRVRTPNDLERRLYNDMPLLNDDCFLHILKYLSVLEIIRVTRSNPCFRAAAANHRHIRIYGNQYYNRMTLMQLRELLRELHFGVHISSLYISSRIFSSEALHYVCDRLYCYLGPQLRSLTMAHFHLRSEEFQRIQPLLLNLEYFDADYKTDFNFQVFNVVWSRLHTLHIRTYGQLDQFLDATENLPAFPVLSRLLLQCNFINSQTVIERVVNACPNLIEFIAVNFSDVYTNLSRIDPIAMNRMTEFQQLQRLMLSFTRRHYPNNFIETICRMTSLQYLMLDVVKNSIRDNRPMDEINENLIALGNGLPQLRELQLIGVAIDNGNFLRFIDVAANLETIAILECPRFTFVPNFVRSIVDRRREMFRNAGLPTKQLRIIVDQSLFDNISLNENDLGDLVIVQHGTCFDLYKNHLPKETIDCMRSARMQMAVAQVQHDMMVAAHRDNVFLRQDDGPFLGRRRLGRRLRVGAGMLALNFPPHEDPDGVFALERHRRLRILDRAIDENFDSSDSD